LFRIKICGVTSPKDAQLIALAGADAVGLNFFADSSRYVEADVAQKIATVVPPSVARVGVFVNSPAGVLRDTTERLKLDWIQLHGDETPELIAEIGGQRVVKAFRIGESGWDEAVAFLARCKELGSLPAAVLLDASQPGEYGGTGKTIDWQSVADNRPRLFGLPIVLAGGLTPFNVTEAIATARPDAVDVASGVESKSGSKDLMLIRAFVTSAKKALDGIAN
jgi:phosphoribosylanthranilate isomerase